MAYTQIRSERRGRVGWITLDRPQFRNAQSRVLLEELDDAFAAAGADDEIRVVVLAGAGEHFSSGHDLGTPEEKEDATRRPWAEGVRGQLERTWDLHVEKSLRWRDLPKPTIAAVQGYCIFGGYLVASVMDLIVAAEDARFLPAHVQLFTAPWDLGIKKSKEVLFENRFIEAEEALELGFVNKLVPRAELESETLAMAERIASQDLLSLRMTKFSINQAQDAMGFRTSAHAAHSNFMVLASGGVIRKDGEGERRLTGVGRALAEEPTRER